jgi:hypothetical protein
LGIFGATVAWSANPGGSEADITAANTTRKGSALNLNPALTGANWQLGYSYWRQKADVAGAATGQRGDALYGFYRWGGFKLGMGWNKSRVINDLTGADATRRTAWTIPASYMWGKHNIYGHYTRANDEQVIAGDQSARMWAFAYVYDLSKRTSAGVTYAKIRNSTLATYNFFTNANTGAFGSVGAQSAADEDPRLIAFTVRHAF